MRKGIGIVIGVLLFGCGGPGSGGDDDPGAPDAAVGSGELRAVTLPQTIAGAMWANPLTYPEIPLQVAIDGEATAVTVSIGAETHSAADPDADGTWTAQLPIAALSSGIHQIDVIANGPNGEQLTASADLGVGVTGIQLTDFDLDGAAGTPRLHRVGDELWLTWADRSDSTREIWLRRMDGAGRWLGDRVRLVGDEDETLYARVAVGADSLGVLYQKNGGPYSNFFKRVDAKGNAIGDPITLDPKSMYGSYGGAVTYDGGGFVVVWRVNDGAGGGEVRWMRVDEITGEIAGPVVVAASGSQDPVGGFDPFTFITVQTVGELSLVGFVRKRYDQALDLALPKGQLAVVDRAGTLVRSDYASPESGWMWNFESRVFGVGDRALLLWSAQDLTAADPIPTTFRAALTDTAGVIDPARGEGALVLNAPDHRVEPHFIAHPEHLGVLAWLDERSYSADLLTGRIELYVAAVSENLSARNERVFSHARFIEGTSQLGAASAGTNVVLVWLDERHGNGITDSRPEIWLETAWY